LAGSLLGALLLLRVPQHSVSLIVSGAMIAVAIFSVVYRKSGKFSKLITSALKKRF